MSEAKKAPAANHVRDFFLQSTDKFKEETVSFKDHQGQEISVLIREPKAKQRGQIFKAATIIRRNQEPEIDHAELQVWAVIYCAYDPKTGEPLFEPAHRDVLLNLPTSIFDVIAKPALSMLGEDPEEVAGN